MKTIKLLLFVILFTMFYSVKAQESCDVFINKMDSLASKENTEDAKKLMKYYIACQGEKVDAENPVVKNLNKLSYFTKFYMGRALGETIDKKNVIIDENFNVLKIIDFTTVPRGGFIDGLARVNVRKNAFNDKWGYINTKGEIAIPVIYSDALPFKKGIAKVQKSGKQGYIDTNGNEIIPIIYNYVWNIGQAVKGDLIVVSLDNRQNKKGLYDIKGKMLLEAKYQGINDREANGYYIKDGLIRVYYKDKIFYINKKGECVKDCL